MASLMPAWIHIHCKTLVSESKQNRTKVYQGVVKGFIKIVKEIQRMISKQYVS